MHIFMRRSEIAFDGSMMFSINRFPTAKPTLDVPFLSIAHVYPFSCNSLASANHVSDNAVISML